MQKKLEQYFYEALNSSALPAEYAEALNANQKDAALKIAIRYFRTRCASAYWQDLATRQYDKSVAENAAEGNVTVVNIPYQFPEGRIDFLYNPTLAMDVHNLEWQWQLNRMYFWTDMALAYLHSGDEKFAKVFAQQVYDWVTNIPCPAENWNSGGSAWRTIETGLRLMGSWQTAFEIFRKSQSVPDETLALMLASMCEQAHHALNHCTTGNWLMMELNGAYTFAVLFPEFKISPDIRKRAAQQLSGELNKQLLPDGWQNELSPDYHTVVFNCAFMMFKNAKICGFPDELPADFSAMLERAADAWLRQMTPGFTQPCTNDCYIMDSTILLQKVCTLYPHRKDFLWGATRGKEGTPPEGKTASHFFPWAGFAVMRSGWDANATYLCFDTGPLGVHHEHQDKLNINIFKGGEELLFDDGGGQYDNSPQRSYALSGRSHNTILVDDLPQLRKGPKAVDKEIDANFITNDKFDYACGIYDDTYGNDFLKPASHKREVLFVKPDFFAVADTVTSCDGKEHDYTMLLQLDTLTVNASSNAVHGILNGKYDLYALLLSEPEKVITESAQLNPVSGWYAGRNNRDLHPATTVKISSGKTKDFRFLTLFFPVKKGTQFPTAERLSACQWKITFNGQESLLDLDNLKKNL